MTEYYGYANEADFNRAHENEREFDPYCLRCESHPCVCLDRYDAWLNEQIEQHYAQVAAEEEARNADWTLDFEAAS